MMFERTLLTLTACFCVFLYAHETSEKKSTATIGQAENESRSAEENFQRLIADTNSKFQMWKETYRPDYSDSSAYLGAPLKGRIAIPLPLVRNGLPAAEIIFNKTKEIECVATAAAELQLWIKKITGAKLPILYAASPEKNTKIYLGKSLSPYSKDLERLNGRDGYAVRNDRQKIYIFGSTGKWTMNGVYVFLANNTDIIWARPGGYAEELAKYDDYAVYSETRELNAVWGNGFSIPALEKHGYGVTANYRWLARNLASYYQGGGGGDIVYTLKPKRRWGDTRGQVSMGHNLWWQFLPWKQYFGRHPEFYSLVNGVRKTGAQLCFTNPEMKKEYIRNVLDFLRKSPPDSRVLYIGIDDTWEACGCDSCRAPIKGKSGKMLTLKDENFRSTQYFMFLNRVAAAMNREFPRMSILTLAYFSTAPVPDCDLHNAIRPDFCPYVRANEKSPITSAENIKWLETLRGWSKICKNIDAYEYYCLGMEFPRPIAEVKQFDFPVMFPYWKHLAAEFQFHPQAFDWSSMEYWVMLHQMWNPSRNPEKLRKYYIRRTFRNAAPEMERFYGMIRSEFYRSPRSSNLGDSALSLTKQLIIDAGLEDSMRARLVAAEKAESNSRSLIHIKNVRKAFERNAAAAKAIKTPSVSVPLIPPGDRISFDSKVWTRAVEIDSFLVCGSQKVARHPTRLRMFHDSFNLYFRFSCEDKDIAHAKSIPLPAGKNEAVAEDDHIEIFIQNQRKAGEYYLFSVNVNNQRGDARNYDESWNGEWRSTTRITRDRWETIVEIPLKNVEFDIKKHHTLRATCIREYSKRTTDAAAEYSSWGGGRHHSPVTFGSMRLMK